MRHDLTHASFFSGVGGLDLGLERVGWRTVSFSEIDPYASAVLAERWPGVPNLGDITRVVESDPSTCYATDWSRAGAGYYAGPCHRSLPCQRHNALTYGRWLRQSAESTGVQRRGAVPDAGSESEPMGRGERPVRTDWRYATLWSGGFPCQDLSVAGKRRGLAGERSGLAFAFLDLVERHRPPAILLENVPGLLSSNGGRDLGALLRRLGELGYWWAYRILDAQFFGVPQRRRRVFICALHAGAGFGADSAAAVLSVGARCDGHSQESDEEGEGAANRFADGIGAAGPLPQAVTAKWYRGSSGPAGDEHHNMVVQRPSPDPGGVREADGLAGRLDDSPVAFRKSARVNSDTSPETWVDDGLANTLNSFDVGDIRTTHIAVGGRGVTDDEMLPLGLDSHRYRTCGNGVVANVAEWIGVRIATAVQGVGVQS